MASISRLDYTPVEVKIGLDNISINFQLLLTNKGIIGRIEHLGLTSIFSAKDMLYTPDGKHFEVLGVYCFNNNPTCPLPSLRRDSETRKMQAS